MSWDVFSLKNDFLSYFSSNFSFDGVSLGEYTVKLFFLQESLEISSGFALILSYSLIFLSFFFSSYPPKKDEELSLSFWPKFSAFVSYIVKGEGVDVLSCYLELSTLLTASDIFLFCFLVLTGEYTS